VAIRVDHHLVLGVDDQDRIVRVLEERAILALAPAQLVVRRLALHDPAELRADEPDDVDEAWFGTSVAVGEELQHREHAFTDEDGKGEDRARPGSSLRDFAGRREALPQRAALREHAIRERAVGRIAPRLRERAVLRQALRIVEVPEGAVREIARVGRELQATGLPTGVRADAGDRRAQRIVHRRRFVSGLGDRLQQTNARCGQLLQRRIGHHRRWVAHTGAVTDA
jgi:hypothetical protein